MADDLVSRFTATLDEIERLARTATKGPWKASGPGEIVGVVRGTEFLVAARVQTWNKPHIVRWDPQAVLRLVGAVRELIADYEYHEYGNTLRAIQMLAPGFGVTEED